MNKEYFNLFKSYLKDIRINAGYRGTIIIFLNLVLIPLEGLAVMLLLPLLSAAGILTLTESTNIVEKINAVFNYLGLSPTIEVVLSLYVIILGLEALVKFLDSIVSAHVTNDFARNIRRDLFDSIAFSSWNFITETKHSKISQILTIEVQRVKAGTTIFFRTISIFIIALINLAIAFYVSYVLTVLIIISGLVLVAVVYPINKKIKRSSEKSLGQRGKLFSVIKDYLDGIKISKSFGIEKHYSKNFNGLVNEIEDEFNRYSKINSFNSLILTVSSGILICILLFASVKIISTPPATLLLLIYLFMKVVPRITSIQQNYLHVLNTLPSYKEVVELSNFSKSNHERIITDKVSTLCLDNHIKFENVAFSYDKENSQALFENLSFHIEARNTTALIGPSGQGKTTLIDILMGLQKPAHGNIFIDEVELGESNIFAWRNKIGYVPQEPYLINDSIKNNVMLGKVNASNQEVIEALQISSAYEFIKDLPEGMNTIVKDRGQRFSGGERQRIALARALIRKPEVLILDEATNAIDSENENKIFDAIEKLHHKLTIIIISHRESTVKRADRILQLENGVIKELELQNL